MILPNISFPGKEFQWNRAASSDAVSHNTRPNDQMSTDVLISLGGLGSSHNSGGRLNDVQYNSYRWALGLETSLIPKSHRHALRCLSHHVIFSLFTSRWHTCRSCKNPKPVPTCIAIACLSSSLALAALRRFLSDPSAISKASHDMPPAPGMLPPPKQRKTNNGLLASCRCAAPPEYRPRPLPGKASKQSFAQ